MQTGRFVCTAVVAAAALFQPDSAFAQWPATEFQAVAREPTPAEIAIDQTALSIGAGISSLLGSEDNSQNEATQHASRWFGEISSQYRAAGHSAPALQPIVDAGGGQAYRVYLFPYAGSRTRDGSSAGGSYETNTCMNNNKVPWLSINHDAKVSKIFRDRYWAIGHELMHSLMFGDRVFSLCNRNSFEVSEGIPEGAALFIMDKKFRGFIGGINTSNSAVGLRSYRLPFFIFKDIFESEKSDLEKNTGYGTSSFWRFLAERFGGLGAIRHFLELPIKQGASQKDMYQWLENRLQSLPGLRSGSGQPSGELPGFYEVYPAFATEFASYGGRRYMSFDWRRFTTWQQARDVWLIRAFGGCQRVTLNPEKRNNNLVLSLHENASGCFRVLYSGFSGNVAPSIEIVNDSVRLIDQLHLGWAWKIGPDDTENCYEKRKELGSKWPPCVYKAFTKTGPQAGQFVRTWPLESLDFGTQGDGLAERVYVLSNVAVKPWTTAPAVDIRIKVAVSDMTSNGEPAEPVEQLMSPRKPTSSRNPAKPVGKEELYGLQTDPPAPDADVKGFSLNPYTPGRDRGVEPKRGGYAVQVQKMKYGQTGPVRGMVALQPNDPRARDGIVSSALCADPSRPIGRVLQSDEDALRVEVDVNLCRASGDNLKQCEDGCPVVDHVAAEVNIAFGWRSFSETAPTDIRTPGIERYISTMPDSLEEAMRFGAGTALPEDGVAGTESPIPGIGAGKAAGGGLASCTCTCEEMAANEAAAAELKLRIQAGEEPSMAQVSSLSRCSRICQSEYLICLLQQDQRDEQMEQTGRDGQREAPQTCDCSCVGIDARSDRVRQLEVQFMKGSGVATDELAELSSCAAACQIQMVECAPKG